MKRTPSDERFEVTIVNRALTASSSWRQFLRYVFPSVSAMLLFSLYTVVDGIFVAKGVGPLALTAVNIAPPFVNFMSGFSILISMGTATLCSFALGAGRKEEAESLFTQTVVVILAVSAALTATVSFLAPSLAGLLGADASTLEYTTSYLRIISLFAVCFILSYCLEVMVKVDDNPKMAVIGVSASFVTNIVLDYIFIFHFHWGVAGAAWATGIAQVVSLVIFLGYFFSSRAQMHFRRFTFRPKSLLRIFPLGVADCSVELIVGFLTMLYNHVLLMLMGENGQTIYAVVAYVNLFVFMIMQGVAQGMMHLASLHIGRGETEVTRRYFSMSIRTVILLGCAAVAFCWIAPQVVTSLLLPLDSPVFQQTLTALRFFSLSFPLAGLNIVLAGYFTAWEKPGQSAVVSLGRGFILAPIAVLSFAFLVGGQSIWLAALCGEALCLVVGLLILRRTAFTMREPDKEPTS